MAQAPTIAARIDRLPPSSHIYRLVLLISLGGCFEFYDLFLTAYVAPGLIKSGIFQADGSPFEFGSLASFVSALFTGLFIGTIGIFGLAFSQQTAATGIIICGLLVTLSNNWLSYSFHAYQAELYPTRIRAQAVGFVYSWSRFTAIFNGFIIALLLGRWGSLGVFSFIAGAMVIVFITIGFFGPKTSRRRLEAIAG